MEKYVESWSLCLTPDFKWNAFRFSPFHKMLAMDLAYSLYYVEACSFCFYFLWGFSSKMYWIMSNVFPAWSLLFEKSCDFYPQVCVLYYIYWSVILNCSYTHGMKTPWSEEVAFLMCCWAQFASIILRITVFIFIREVGPLAFWFCCALTQFGYQNIILFK